MGFYGPDFPDPLSMMLVGLAAGIAVGESIVALLWFFL